MRAVSAWRDKFSGQRRNELLLFLLLWFSFAYFHHSAPGWNVNSRLALTYALVEQGTVRIDDFRNHRDVATDDVAVFAGHFYSDKIIGTSLLGVPAFALVKAVEFVRDERLSWPVRRYLVTVLSVGLIAAASGVLLLRLLMLYQRRWFGDSNATGPLVVTCLHFFGTQVFFYSTLFMPYLPAQFFLLGALFLLERAHERPNGKELPLFQVGLLTGCALLCEYTVGIAAGFMGAYALYLSRDKLRIWRYATGALVAVIPFIIYCYAIFGKFAIPYEYEHNQLFREQMSRGFMGARMPRAAVLWLTTFHPFRGIFIHSPHLLISLAGLSLMLARKQMRPVALLVASIAAAYLLFNSAYYMWWGGYSFGPRHLIPMLPFLCIPLLAAWHFAIARWMIILLGIMGVGIHLIVNSVEPQFPDRATGILLEHLLQPSFHLKYQWPFITHIWPAFWSGVSDKNLGTVLGLPSGALSLLPLFAVWIGGIGALRRSTTRQKASPTAP